MNRIQRIAGIMAACAATVVITSDMHAQEDLFVRIAPCRVLNTATKPADDAGEENERRIDVRASRCGRIIPPFATAYSVR